MKYKKKNRQNIMKELNNVRQKLTAKQSLE